MIKTNVEIAKMVEDRGYDFQTALESIDFGRTAEEEEMEITQEEAIAMGEYHEVEATEEEIREYAMYGCPDADMQFLF